MVKRFWKSGLAIVATVVIVGTAIAQTNPSPPIGTYQQILARSGYGDLSAVPDQAAATGYAPAPTGVPLPPGGSHSFAPNVQSDYGSNHGNCDSSVAACGCGNGNCLGCRRKRLIGGRLQNGQRATTCDSNYIDQSTAYGSSPVYEPGAVIDTCVAANVDTACNADIGNSVASASKNSNWVFGVFGVTFRRDYEDRRRLGYCSPGEFYSTDVSNGDFSGVGVSLGKRSCTGRGWEAVFWGLSTADDLTVGGPTYTYLTGFGDLNHIPSGATVWDIYNAGDNVRLYRDTEIYNFEFNVLRNGGQYTNWRGAQANYELLAGFRLFQFNEELRYVSNSSAPGYPTTLDYALDAENTLAGFQVGGRNEVCLSRRWKMTGGASFGLFNNHIETNQRITDETGYSPLIATGPATGRPFDYSDEKNDAAVLGQFDIGFACCLTR